MAVKIQLPDYFGAANVGKIKYSGLAALVNGC